jgi:uncharacterized protein YjbI with pentapeptide repeats
MGTLWVKGQTKYLKVFLFAGLAICVLVISVFGLFIASYAGIRSSDSRLRNPAVSIMLINQQIGVSQLEKVLSDPGVAEPTRLAIIQRLSNLQNKPAQRVLVKLLKITDTKIQSAIMAALASEGESVLGYLIDSIDQQDLRPQAAGVLVQISRSVPIHIDLHGKDLSDLDLTGCFFEKANLSAVNFRESNLTGCVLRSADLSGANLVNSKLNLADLTDSRLEGANLAGADLTAVELRGSNIQAEQLGQASSLVQAGLQSLNLAGVNLEDMDLSNANLADADLSSAIFKNANFTGVDLSRANLTGSDITPNQLTATYNINGVSLVGQDFSFSNLTGLDFSGADLRQVNFGFSKLTDTRFDGANLSGAVLSGSNISPTQLAQASNLIGIQASGFDFHGADLSGLNLTKAILDNTNLSNTNLSGTNFSEVSLKSANLSGSNITPEQLTSSGTLTYIRLEGLDLSGANFSDLDLSFTSFFNTNLSLVNFQDANLTYANFEGANLTDSHLTFEQFISAKTYKGLILPKYDFSSRNLSRLNLESADLTQSIFRNANLRSTTFSHAILTDADFHGAILDSANLSQVTGFTPAMLESAASTTNVFLQSQEELLETAGQVCFGQTFAQAIEGKPDFQPTLILWDQQFFRITPEGSLPWINYLVNIACVSSSEKVIQRCTDYYYQGTNDPSPDIERVRYEINVNIFKTRTGELLATKLFKGKDPRYCQNTENYNQLTYKDSNTVSLYGDEVDHQLVDDWIFQTIFNPSP